MGRIGALDSAFCHPSLMTFTSRAGTRMRICPPTNACWGDKGTSTVRLSSLSAFGRATSSKLLHRRSNISLNDGGETSQTTGESISLRIRPLVERERAARLNASARSRILRAAPHQFAEPEFLPLHGRKLRDASGHSARSKLPAVRGTVHCQSPKDRGEVQ